MHLLVLYRMWMTVTEAESGERTLLSSVRVTRNVGVGWVVVSSASFFLFAYVFAAVSATIHGESLQPVTITVPSPSLGVIVGPPIAIVLVVIAHELVHGVLMTGYGGRPRYGVAVTNFVIPHAYASTTKVRYTRNEMLVILLGPFVVITLLGLPLLSITSHPLLVGALAINAAGSMGDLWMALALVRYPSTVRVGGISNPEGFGVYATGDVQRRRGTTTLRSTVTGHLVAFCTGFVGTISALVTLCLILILASLAFSPGDVVIGDPDGRWFLLRHELEAVERTALLEIGTTLFAAVSIAGGIAWSSISIVRCRVVCRSSRKP